MDLYEGITYRSAYGLAHRLAEARRHNFFGRYRNSPAAGGDLEAILAELRRLLRLVADDGPEAELVRRGVEDALAGRRPRW